MIKYSKFLLLSLLLVMASACATEPIAKQYRQEARAEDLTFSMVFQNPEAYVGDIVLWGGVIVETTNLKNGTEIIVLQTPLGGEERPKSAKHSRGRFIAMSEKFLDPALYRWGRKITLAGQVAGKKTLALGKTSYTYPVVTIKQLHLWKRRTHYVYPYYWGWGPYWGWWPGYYYGDMEFDGGFDEDEEEGEGEAD